MQAREIAPHDDPGFLSAALMYGELHVEIGIFSSVRRGGELEITDRCGALHPIHGRMERLSWV
jgi:hypothetical protein